MVPSTLGSEKGGSRIHGLLRLKILDFGLMFSPNELLQANMGTLRC
jgi:hypothetical protein